MKVVAPVGMIKLLDEYSKLRQYQCLAIYTPPPPPLHFSLSFLPSPPLRTQSERTHHVKKFIVNFSSTIIMAKCKK